jgi:hypothetical protein
MSEFTLKTIHDTDPQLYYAGLLHSYSYQKNAKVYVEGEDRIARSRGYKSAVEQKEEMEAHRGACFFFAVAAFIRCFGKLPATTEDTKAVEALLDSMGVPPRWRSSGPASSQAGAGSEPSGPSAPL